MTVIGHNFVLFSQQKGSFLRQSDCFVSDLSLTSFLIMVINWNCISHVPVARLPVLKNRERLLQVGKSK